MWWGGGGGGGGGGLTFEVLGGGGGCSSSMLKLAVLNFGVNCVLQYIKIYAADVENSSFNELYYNTVILLINLIINISVC